MNRMTSPVGNWLRTRCCSWSASSGWYQLMNPTINARQIVDTFVSISIETLWGTNTKVPGISNLKYMPCPGASGTHSLAQQASRNGIASLSSTQIDTAPMASWWCLYIYITRWRAGGVRKVSRLEDELLSNYCFLPPLPPVFRYQLFNWTFKTLNAGTVFSFSVLSN